ncbi:MAG: SPFH domain-containing protein [Planctomycetota bacterium]
MKTFLLACLLGIVGLALGLVLFGQMDGEKIVFEKKTLEKVDSFEEFWPVAKAQPAGVYICGGIGFFVGFLTGLALWIGRRIKERAGKKAAGTLTAGVVPDRAERKPVYRELRRLESERPLVCKLLGLLTLGICKFYAVPQGNALVVVAFGKHRKVCQPGLRGLLSFWGLYQRPYKNIPLIQLKENTAPFENETVFTSDGVRCKLDVMVCYKVVDSRKALFEVDNYQTAIQNIVRAVLRNECSRQPGRKLLAAREQIAADVRAALEPDVKPWGVAIRLVEITFRDIPEQDTVGPPP